MTKKEFLPLLHSMELEEVQTMMLKVEAVQDATNSKRLACQMEMVLLHLSDRQDDLGYDDSGSYDEMMFYGGTDYNMSDQDIENYYHDLKCGDDRNESHEPDDEREPYVRYVRPSIVQLLQEAKAFALKCEHLKTYGVYDVRNRFTEEYNPFCVNCCARLKQEEGRTS